MIEAFLMAGQSHMAGRGIIGDVPPIPHEGRMLMLRSGRWQPMSEPINPDRAVFVDDRSRYRSGIGPAASFAQAWTRHRDGRVGLIPCADGGTAIAAWEPGGILFDNAVFAVRLARRSGGVLRGILWAQGESDSKDPALAAAHRDKLAALIAAFRYELGEPDLPFLMGGVDVRPRYPYAETVNEGMRALCAEDPRLAFVPVTGFSVGPDGIHYTAADYREFGRRYWAAFAAMTGEPPEEGGLSQA